MIKKCEYCYKNFETLKEKKTCNRSCGMKLQWAKGQRKTIFKGDHRSNYDKWYEKYGKEKADELRCEYSKTMSKAILNADMSYQKEIAKQKRIEYNKSLKGKTVEEIYGFEKGQQIRQKQAQNFRGEKNPAYGKVYINGGKSVKGYYKSHFFRSLLEYSFMKHLEQKGFDLETDVDYENHVIPYEFKERRRTYRPDFEIIAEKRVYEVKPAYALKNAQNQAKWSAAREYFLEKNIQFSVVTENEFKKILFNDALKDPDIIWKKETFKYFKQK